MPITPQTLHHHLNRLVNTQKFLIAYSGGVDSHVLLHLCAALKNSPSGSDLEFSAVYIDHGLSPNAQHWGQHCQQVCNELDIPLSIIEVNARADNGQSPEAAARKVRYQAFSEILTPGECLLTAQHLDDQAETLLLQLMRGSGTRGLSAMPVIKPFAQGWHCRPMLEYSKQTILGYAQLHQLHWVDDESNQQQHYDRNFLRHSILPELKKHWPAVQRNLSRTAQVLAESQTLLDEMAQQDFNQYAVTDQHRPQKKLKAQLKCPDSSLSSARVHNLLRYWIHDNGLPMPSRKILQQVVQHLIPARGDASPLVHWKRDELACEIRKYRDVLYLIKHTGQPVFTEAQRRQSYTLNQQHSLELLSIGSLSLQKIDSKTGTAYDKTALLSQALTVRFRQGGERFKKYPDAPSSMLKHWFQEQGIPPWERDFLPLIYRGDELIQVGNSVLNKTYLARNGVDACIIVFKCDR